MIVSGKRMRCSVNMALNFRSCWRLAALALLLFLGRPLNATADLARREWKIDGMVREGLLHVPSGAKTNATPVVFAFHGHGGSMSNAAKMFHIEELWPEAIVVYMQGVNTPGRLTDLEGKRPGWQFRVGDHDDRDLKFFDAVLASLKRDHKVHKTRIYALGHSNGGSFTYLLWEARPEIFAAFAPSAAISVTLVPPADSETLKDGKTKRAFIPKPVLHVAGENDQLVKFEWQKKMIEAVRRLNQCGEVQPWISDNRCLIYPSRTGADVVTFIHSGQHNYPPQTPAIIVKFFKHYSQH